MFRRHEELNEQRRAIILLVVLALLTLFSIVGISFVLYANNEANSARNVREGESPPQADMDPELLLAYFLGQLIYDVPDDATGLNSCIRGHSLARTLFGLDYSTPDPTNNQIMVYQANNVPFNGTGRLHTVTPTGAAPRPGDFNNPFNIDDHLLVNYSYHKNDRFLRDPERLGCIQRGNYRPWRTDPTIRDELPGYYTGGFNPPYTYPDLNNMFLAAVQGSTGAVLMPSFHRHWLFNDPGKPFNDPTNTNWTNREGKYKLLRPRPSEMGPGFPFPEDAGGDVKNLTSSPGTLLPNGTFANNDSVWMDLGAPVMIAPDGTKFKPLFAPLIIDLDNRINLNVHGNVRGRLYQQHASNQGWGPWEVNLNYILNGPVAESQQVFHPATQPQQWGRYGVDLFPTTLYPTQNMALPGTASPFYSPVDYDGTFETPYDYVTNPPPMDNSNGPSDPIYLPGLPYQVGNQFFVQSFPVKPSTGARFNGYGNGSPNERFHHPMLFNFFDPQKRNNNDYDLTFPISNMEAMLRYGETNSPGFTSSLFHLGRQNFNDNLSPLASMRRRLVTTHSFAFDRAGIKPWFWQNPSQTNSMLEMAPPTFSPTRIIGRRPSGPAIPFPPLSLRGNGIPGNSEFQQSDWRAVDAAIRRVDLNRYLTPYPATTPGNGINTAIAAQMAQFQAAQNDRVNLATDIYLALVEATGAYHPFRNNANQTSGGPTANQFRALRWLAQLAVNIVDFIDSDDIMTPFPWKFKGNQGYIDFLNNPSNGFQNEEEYVFGTELPRVVINEIYSEYHQTGGMPGSEEYEVDVWVELVNLFQDTPAPEPCPDPNRGNAILQMPPQFARPSYPVYQVVLSDVTSRRTSSNPFSIRDPNNVRGNIRPNDSYHTSPITNGPCIINSFSGSPVTTVIKPSNGRYTGNNQVGQNNDGFYVIGPTNPTGTPKPFPSRNTPDPATYPNATLSRPEMTYKFPPPPPITVTNRNPNQTINKPRILLRRLCCPYLPPNYPSMNLDGLGNYVATLPFNPFITVDYVTDFNVNDGSNPSTIHSRQSTKKSQPYFSTTIAPQNLPANSDQNQPKHSFFRHNGTTVGEQAGTPFLWLAHLDRQLISPMELLNVSAYKPHELTQQFFDLLPDPGDQEGVLYRHRASWFDQKTRLYRVFELLENHSLAAGVAPGGRIPGPININTVWDKEIFLALADAQPSNAFFDPPPFPVPLTYNANRYVLNAFMKMLAIRSVSPQGIPGPGDRPFLGMAAGYSAPSANDPQFSNRAQGINDTFLRDAISGNNDLASTTQLTRVFQTFNVPTDPYNSATPNPPANPQTLYPLGANPYLEHQMVTKLFNNITTRSNVFAVWVTVGFFKVTDDTTTPVKLGAEIGKAENRHIRHQMFAIVDRSNITVEGPPGSRQIGGPPILLSGQAYIPNPATPPAQNTPMVCWISGAAFANGKLTGFYEDNPWKIEVNDIIVVNYGKDLSGQNQAISYKVGSINPGNLAGNPPVPPTIALKDPVSGIPTLYGDFMKKHGSPFLISLPKVFNFNQTQLGNPGPQARYNPRDYPWVVRYLSIIH